MSAVVKLSGKMPGNDDINGLDSLVGDLIADPRAIRVAVVYFDVSQVTEDTDTGDHIPTVRVRRFEPIGPVGDVAPEIRSAVLTAHELRTGRKPLPFEVIVSAEKSDHEIVD